MSTPTILGPQGLPLVDLSGDRAFRQYTKGDIVGSLQWIDLRAHNPEFDEPGPVPCMALFHAHRHSENGAYVIPQRAAYKYVKSDGSGPTIFFHNAVALATLQLGFGPHDKSAMHRIIDVVMDLLADLLKMPSEQPDALEIKHPNQGIVGTFKVGGKVIHAEEF